MKTAGMLAILFVFLSFNALADDVALSDNPYALVVERNIFGLVPIPVASPPDTKPPDPPSKITPNGIMNLFGELQVLFKVSVPPRPGLPPHDQSYTMSVGERSDGIEVTKIDKQAGVITFDNHGVIQELSLSKAVASAAPQPAAAPTGSRSPGFNGFRGRQNSHENQSFGGSNYNPPVATTSYGNNNSAPSYGSASATGGNNNTSQSQSTDDLSLESKVVMMEAQRAQWQQQGNPAMAIMPPPIVKGVGGDDSPTTPSGPTMPSGAPVP